MTLFFVFLCLSISMKNCNMIVSDPVLIYFYIVYNVWILSRYSFNECNRNILSSRSYYFFDGIRRHVCFTKSIPVVLIKKIPWIDIIEHDHYIESLSTVQSNVNWGLSRISKSERISESDFTYEYEWTGKKVNVYIIDSGIDIKHP
ncbi:unnamed protein product, partial [Sphagnum compactum]